MGRTVNPVSGAVGLLWTGNWHVCQTAVMTVLRGGTIEPLPEFDGGVLFGPELDNVSESGSFRPRDVGSGSKRTLKRKRSDDVPKCRPTTDLDLSLMYQRAATPSDESETTTLGTGLGNNCGLQEGERKLLRLFV